MSGFAAQVVLVKALSPWFPRLSNHIRNIAGAPPFSSLLVIAAFIWLVIGPFVGFSSAWELSATAGAPILALLLLVVMQHTHNRDNQATQLKLNEIIRATEHASDRLIGIEDNPQIELARLVASGDTSRAARAQGSLCLGPPAGAGGSGRGRHHPAARDLGSAQCFVFRSHEGAPGLAAHNLSEFVQLAEVVDEPTWQAHLERGDYSRWFREAVGNENLAAIAARFEDAGDEIGTSREHIVSAVLTLAPPYEVGNTGGPG